MTIADEIQALSDDRTAIQDAIVAKGGTVTSADGFDDFALAIGTIPSGGIDISDTTAIAADVRVGKYFYTADGTKTQGTIATYAGEHHTPGYAVAISLTNSYDIEFFDTCEVYQLNSRNLDEYGYYDDFTLLGTIDSPTGSTTVTVDDAALAIVIVLNGTGMGVVVYDSPTISSNITDLGYLQKPYPDMGASNSWFEVSGAGTITLSNIDWDDD